MYDKSNMSDKKYDIIYNNKYIFFFRRKILTFPPTSHFRVDYAPSDLSGKTTYRGICGFIRRKNRIYVICVPIKAHTNTCS